MNVYAYGCYCLNLGKYPLSGLMSGVYPVDDKDRHCFEFTKKGFLFFLLRKYTELPSESVTAVSLLTTVRAAFQKRWTTTSILSTMKLSVPIQLAPVRAPFASATRTWSPAWGSSSTSTTQPTTPSRASTPWHSVKWVELEVWIKIRLITNRFQLKPRDPNKPKAEMNCCGEYPNRRPYDSNKSMCCNGKVTHDNQCVW